VFQDPASSLDPRMTVARIVDEPLDALYAEITQKERRDRVAESLARVGLSSEFLRRHPHELSGGQAQRVAIARALVVRPRILICDEPVSALDASVQAQILNLLRKLQHEEGLSLIFIAHDLAAVRYLSHRVMVMYLGRVMEVGPVDAVLGQPMHPYTKALLAAVPGSDPQQRAALVREGDLPDPRSPPCGCVFRSRCPMADERCAMAVPAGRRTPSGSTSACLHAPMAPQVPRIPDPALEPQPEQEEEGPDPFR
jgi:oligopeptide transport system ATP-binding protein